MFAQLGNIIFENAGGFNSFEMAGEAVLAEHAIYNSKPLLQKTGIGLEEVTIAMRLHATFGNPESRLTALRTARDAGEVLPLLWGNGKVAGSFVIKSISSSIEDALQDGTPLSIMATVILKEYAKDDQLQRQQSKARTDAKAVSKKPPVQGVKKKTNTCASKIAAIFRQLQGYAVATDKEIRAFVATPFVLAKIRYAIQKVHENNNALLAAAGDPSNCVSSYVAVKTRCEMIKQDAAGIENVIAAPFIDETRLNILNRTLQADVAKLKRDLEPLLKDSITRK